MFFARKWFSIAFKWKCILHETNIKYLVIKIKFNESLICQTMTFNCNCFILQTDRVTYEQFRAWVLRNRDATSVTRWLLQDAPTVSLSNNQETPTFYQTLAGVTHCMYYRADSRFTPSQWETALHCNDVIHWLGANLESALYYISQKINHIKIWYIVHRSLWVWAQPIRDGVAM